ncbi:phytanoyl-dioxygenase family protein [Colletotrichum truncatum]|uniref:Phytanoyl-dioxygenase family protein n=1 Tax=Colletotrichum truncatum TaxID=5467 RepID=A0ACC3YEE8_COLTU
MSLTLPAPMKTLTPGLEFSNKPYDVSALDHVKIYQRNALRVRQYIEGRLSDFYGLDELVELRLGDGSEYTSPSLYIESGPSSAKLLNTLPDGLHPSVVVTIMPEHVLDVIEGRMHAVHAFGKRAKPPCRGSFPLCFAPGGRPRLISSADELDSKALPKPTEDIEQVKRDLMNWGYAMVKNALSPEQAMILKTAVEEQAAGERIAGVAHMDGAHVQADDQPNQRVWSLPNKGEEFLDLLNHPVVDAIMPWFLGNAFKLHSMGANIARPAKSGIYMHRDQMGLTPETIDHAYLLNAMWYLIDVTEENGATRIYPGSHNKNVAPSVINKVGTSIPAAAPVGTVVLLDSRVWHSTGVNTSNETRPIILQAFCRFFLQPMENYPSIMSEDVKEQLSDRQLGLLGFPIPVRDGQRPQAYTAYNHPGATFAKSRAPVNEAWLPEGKHSA